MPVRPIDPPLHPALPLRSLRRLVVLGLLCGSSLAAAATATVTSSVNVRAGPGTSFPTATWLLTGTTVTVEGCLPDWRWCDVVAGRDRGWVYSRYLSVRSNDRVATIRAGGASLGLPETEFALGPYWDAHYRNKIWYPRKAEWQQRWDRRAP
jgi:uncharacterized protein YraI